MRNSRINLYLRDSQVLVVPSVRFEVEPVQVVEPVEAALQPAIEEAIRVASTVPIPDDDDYDPKKWVVLKALGLKSAKAFYQNVAHASVLIYNDKIQVQPNAPTKKGQAFEGSGASIEVPDMSSLGAAALKVLKESPRMNPRA